MEKKKNGIYWITSNFRTLLDEREEKTQPFGKKIHMAPWTRQSQRVNRKAASVL